MKCFYHPEKEALGICKNCNKGICGDSMIEIKNGIACNNGICPNIVEQINILIEFNLEQVKKIPKSLAFLASTGTLHQKAHSFNAYFLLCLGLSLLAYSMVDFYHRQYIMGNSIALTGIFGLVFLCFSFLSFKNAKKVDSTFTDIIEHEKNNSRADGPSEP